jgi:hypothetical protein
MRAHSTTNGWIFKKRLARTFRQRRRAQADMFKWQQEQRADNLRIAKMLVAVYGEEVCKAASGAA